MKDNPFKSFSSGHGEKSSMNIDMKLGKKQQIFENDYEDNYRGDNKMIGKKKNLKATVFDTDTTGNTFHQTKQSKSKITAQLKPAKIATIGIKKSLVKSGSNRQN